MRPSTRRALNYEIKGLNWSWKAVYHKYRVNKLHKRKITNDISEKDFKPSTADNNLNQFSEQHRNNKKCAYLQRLITLFAMINYGDYFCLIKGYRQEVCVIL